MDRPRVVSRDEWLAGLAAMRGDTPYFAKITHVFFDMDSMVGKDFETGLANLKAAAE